MSKHTQGPWMLAGPTTISNADQTIGIANVSTYSVETSEANANARLISAAPELLDELKKMVKAFCVYAPKTDSAKYNCVTTALEAIAKAEGQS